MLNRINCFDGLIHLKDAARPKFCLTMSVSIAIQISESTLRLNLGETVTSRNRTDEFRVHSNVASEIDLAGTVLFVSLHFSFLFRA